MRFARHAIGLAIIAGIVALAGSFGLLRAADEGLRDFRFALDERSPSGDIVFVEINAESLEAVGVWPWPRRIYAQVLDRLFELGAREVVLDIDFSVASNPEDDQLFEDALARAGGYALLAAFQQLPRLGEMPVLTMPLPRFADQASPVGVNVSTDSSGTVRSMLPAISAAGVTIPSLAVALARLTPPTGEFLIDYSIDPTMVDRVSLADLIENRVAPKRIEARQVVVGASVLELRDIMVTPVHGALPGALIQIIGAESVKQGRALAPPNPFTTLLLVLCATFLAALMGGRLAHASGIVAALSSMLVLEASAFAAHKLAGVLTDTAATHLIIASGMVLALGLEAFEKRRLHREAAQQRQAALEKLAHAATYDELTGAFTRSAFIGIINDAIALGKPFAVLTFGLDRFDRINGALGHYVGDQVLREVVGRIRQLLDSKMGRIGTDRFALLLIDSGVMEATARAIRLALRQTFIVDGHEVVVGAHVGATGWQPAGEMQTAANLLARSELARGVAAVSPNSALICHSPEMDKSVDDARVMELELRQALTKHQIEVHFQGQVDLQSGRFIGGEALARWRSSELGQVPPSRFIALAEDTGLAVPLGRYLFEEACTLAAHWPRELRLAINVSPSQFEYDDVPLLIDRALRFTNLAPSRLDIEITEGLLLNGGRSTLDMLAVIRSMGVGIALDDFGTGYSSLSYLAGLPISKLKVDQSFVRGLTEDRRMESIVKAVLDMCNSLDIAAVAEGIETEQQASWLRENYCAMGQGYLFHRPSPQSQFLRSMLTYQGGEDCPATGPSLAVQRNRSDKGAHGQGRPL